MEYRADIAYFILEKRLLPIAMLSRFKWPNIPLVYEVIRIKEKSPVFLDEHLARLTQSVTILGQIPPDEQSIRDAVSALLLMNKVNEGNLKLIVLDNQGAFCLFFIPHHYPTVEEQVKGVRVSLQQAERENPQIKISNTLLRQQSNLILESEQLYETLLVNEADEITEGSRSNVFFIKNNQLITAPDQLVLSGITREKTIEIAKGLGIEILFRAVHCSELASFDACFITGTSPELLQVSSINKLTFTLNHPLYCMLKDEYIKLQIV